MTQNLRHIEILEEARRSSKVTVEGLAATLSVTHQTIRRDLAALCETGQLVRVHGGAVLPSGASNIRYDARRGLASAEKTAIAARCAQAIPDGASLFLNIGTTTEAVARALLNHKELMVMTNNLNVANILSNNASIEIIVAGGVLRRSDGGLVGDTAEAFFRQFKVDYAVIGASAVDSDGALLDYDVNEVRVSRAIIENARKTFLVTDHSKFTRLAPVRIAPISAISALFTDQTPPESVRAACETADIQIEISPT